MTREQLQARFPHASKSFIKANAVHSVAGEKHQPSSGHEPMAEDALQDSGKVRRLVRFTLLRQRLLDEDNPYFKPFIDGLKEAGILVDDSPKWCKIECLQRIVTYRQDEGTLIEIEEIPDSV